MDPRDIALARNARERRLILALLIESIEVCGRCVRWDAIVLLVGIWGKVAPEEGEGYVALDPEAAADDVAVVGAGGWCMKRKVPWLGGESGCALDGRDSPRLSERVRGEAGPENVVDGPA